MKSIVDADVHRAELPEVDPCLTFRWQALYRLPGLRFRIESGGGSTTVESSEGRARACIASGRSE